MISPYCGTARPVSWVAIESEKSRIVLTTTLPRRMTHPSERKEQALTAEISVLVADPCPILRRGIALALETQPGLRVVGEAEVDSHSVDMAVALRPDVVLLSAETLSLGMLQAIAAIRGALCDTHIVVLTHLEDTEHIPAAFAVGASSCLSRRAEVVEVIQEVVSLAAQRGKDKKAMQLGPPDWLGASGTYGRSRNPEGPEALTTRELEVVRLVGYGASNRQIAFALYITENTVKTHLCHIYKKLDVHSRTRAVAASLRLGLFGYEDLTRPHQPQALGTPAASN